MRRIAIGLMSTLSGLVLLFSYHTSTNSKTAAASTGTQGTGTTSSGSDSSSSGSSGSSSSGSSGSSSSGSSGTYTGDEASTRWGVVQVQITVENGKITQAQAVQYPQENPRDQEINAYAVPTLNQEVVAAQSGNIDAVSGATVTSEGYLESLQSAIDKANL